MRFCSVRSHKYILFLYHIAIVHFKKIIFYCFIYNKKLLFFLRIILFEQFIFL